MSNNPKGFSLIEVVAALVILAITVAVALPATFRRSDADREKATISEMMEIHRAIVGDIELGTYGFLGDMAKLPDMLTDLIVKPAGAPVFNTNHTNNVGMGWKGPYVSDFSEDDLIRDAWGTPYQYSPTGNNAGQVISAGMDRDINTTSDNIVYPADGPLKTTGDLYLTVTANDIAEPAYMTVNVYSTDNGAESATVITGTTGSRGSGYAGFFYHTLKHGIHAVKATHVVPNSTSISRTVNVGIRAGAQKCYILRMETTATVTLL